MTRKLYVIWTNPIFRDSVRLLLNHPDVNWVGTTSDYGLAKENISLLQPDTVVIEQEESFVPSPIMEALEANAKDFRLIVVNLSDNKLRVFHREQWVITVESDLLNLVLN